MKTKNTFFKIWSFFMLSYLSFLALIWFWNNLDWNNKNILKNVHADDDEQEDEDEEEDDDDININDLINKVVDTSTTNAISNTAIPENISIANTQTWSNCKTIYETLYETWYTTSYETIYDTVTSASGKTSKVARKVEKQIPKQIPKQISKQVCDTWAINIDKTNTWAIEKIINNEIKATTQKLFKAPNSKVYSIIEENWIFSIKKSDWTYAKKTFNTYIEAENYLKQNAIPAPESYKAPNWRYYTIMFENWKVVVKKSDWSYAKQTFTNYIDAKTYLDKNAPKQVIVKKRVVTKKVATTKKTTTNLNTNVVKKTTTTNTAPKVTTPTPKADTTTKAS